MMHVPFNGSSPSLTALMGGQVQLAVDTVVASTPLIKSGKIKAIAALSPQRLALLPNVPTVAEMGFKDFETSQWYGVLAPAGTPPELVKRIQEECYKALKSSAVTARFANDNAVGGGGPSKEFADFIAREQAVWKDIVKRASIKAD